MNIILIWIKLKYSSFFNMMSYFNLIQINIIFIKQLCSGCCVRHHADRLHHAGVTLIIPFNTWKVDLTILALRGKLRKVCWDTVSIIVDAHGPPWICVPWHRIQQESYPGSAQSCGSGASPAESRVDPGSPHPKFSDFLVHAKKKKKKKREREINLWYDANSLCFLWIK